MFTPPNLIIPLMVNYPKEIIHNKGRVREKSSLIYYTSKFKQPKYLMDNSNFSPHHHTPTNITPPAYVGWEACVMQSWLWDQAECSLMVADYLGL